MAGIRRAEAADLPDITEIYNQAVLKTTATFDTEPQRPEERRAWFALHDDKHPILVEQDADRIRGWASLSRYSEREAYAKTVEVSVYVAEDSRGRGIGKRLVTAILAEAQRIGHHAILARITAGNSVSVRLHESFGFFLVGTMREVGTKFGQTLDVHLMELLV